MLSSNIFNKNLLHFISNDNLNYNINDRRKLYLNILYINNEDLWKKAKIKYGAGYTSTNY